MTDKVDTLDAPLDPAAQAARPPAAATRFERGLLRIDGALAWLDGAVARWLSHDANPLAQAGAAANVALSVAILSGVALLVWYSPSLQFAYASVASMEGFSVGGWVRAIHRYSSDLAMLFVLVHAARMFFARKFSGARWLPWVSGVATVGLIWFIGWTGYWLVWDQPAQQVAVTSMRLLDALPIFGEPLGRLYVADRMVPSLLFFVVFFLHMLLPLAIAIGLAIHLMRVSRAKLFPNAKVTAALTVGLILASLLVPAPLEAKAQMATKAASFTVDGWYLTPLALALRFQSAGLWVALFGTLFTAAAIPWLLGRRRAPETYQSLVEPSRCHACTQCVQDCPFDAITMIPRTDEKRFPSQAFVDPAKCVGCGVCIGSCDSEAMSLTWFDTRREEARIEAEVAATRAAGGPAWVAFVAGDSESGLALFEVTRWRERLPGYQIHVVPTAAWVRPKLVEHLLKQGVKGVLIVRDSRAESAARDGNRWVSMRLAGERKPVFRADRAGDSTAWHVVDFDPARPAEVSAAAAAFCESIEPRRSVRPQRSRRAAAVVGGTILAVLLAAATIAPSHLQVNNPAPMDPEFVFSFTALGDLIEDQKVDTAADAAKPIHMRGRATGKAHRATVVVRLTIDGLTQEKEFRAKGISEDGPAIGEWRVPLTDGPRHVRVEVITGPAAAPLIWSGNLSAEPRRLHVVTFDREAGFIVE